MTTLNQAIADSRRTCRAQAVVAYAFGAGVTIVGIVAVITLLEKEAYLQSAILAVGLLVSAGILFGLAHAAQRGARDFSRMEQSNREVQRIAEAARRGEIPPEQAVAQILASVDADGRKPSPGNPSC